MHPPRRPTRRQLLLSSFAAVAVLLLIRCTTAPAGRDLRTAIEASGSSFDIGTRVVRWHEPDGYDAYRRGKFFTAEDPPDGKLRYSPRRGGLPPEIAARYEADGRDKESAAEALPDGKLRATQADEVPEAIAASAARRGLSLRELQQVVHQFVLHFDVCGTSRQCFKVLQDVRTLSVHFLLDVDGTIYQTLDLREKAHHATYANDFSVGVEIAHPGTFAQPLSADMRRWYEQDAQGWRMKFPAWMTETGVRTKDFVPRPDRPDFVSGPIHGKTYHQFDYTKQQYAALARLCAGLSRVLPRIRLDAPRDAQGQVVQHVLPEAELRGFEGIVGHFHVQQNKTDPGPALQWERLLREARALRDR